MLIDTITTTQILRQDSNGLLQLYDSSRSRWLSVDRSSIYFGINHVNISCDRWFDSISSVGSNSSSYRVPRNCVITCVTIQAQHNSYSEFSIRKNNTTENVVPVIELSNENGKTLDNLNLDLNINDTIQVFLHLQKGNIDYPVVTIELAWRD